jgi:hypothetical protein
VLHALFDLQRELFFERAQLHACFIGGVIKEFGVFAAHRERARTETHQKNESHLTGGSYPAHRSLLGALGVHLFCDTKKGRGRLATMLFSLFFNSC